MLTDLVIPYMMQSEINIKFVNAITYQQLLSMYDEQFRAKIQSLNSALLNETIFLFQLQMMPETLHWKLWKSKDQIIMFLMNIDYQIQELKQSKDRMVHNGQKIVQMHQKLKGNFNFNPQTLNLFVQYLTLLSQNIYTRKAEEFLIFIQHCISVDKWGIKIYQQVIVEKSPSVGNKIAGFFKSQKDLKRQRDFFITITSDGILKSDNHLLQSRVKSMIPFTSQLDIAIIVNKEGYITFQISACAHEQMIIALYKDYVKAINLCVAIRMALKESSYSMPHRFQSFSPRRSNCASKLYNGGAEYFEDLYHQLMSAKKQVCITGWMITPYFLLKRPNSIQSKQYRLDGVLQILAHRGVKIFIICFMQPATFVNNDSQHVQDYLQSLHDNIKVYRHPNDTVPILWSHHQKMVIVDQQVGFMGGLDICWGRWDTPQHRLNDPGLLWDGLDYNNYRTKDVYEPRKYKQSNLNKDFQCRMPWHDIAIQYRGDIVLDLLRHFVQYWYFCKSELLTDPMKVFSFMKKRYNQAFDGSKSKSQRQEMQYYMKQVKKREEAVSFTKKLGYLVNGRQQKLPQLLIEARPGRTVGSQTLQMCRSASQWSIGVKAGKHQSSIHNAYQQLIKESKHFIYIQNQFFMGLQNKIVECLVERISRAHSNNQKFRVLVVLPLLPGFQGDITDPASTVLRIQVHHQYNSISRGGKSLYEQLSYIPNVKDYISFFGLRQSEVVNGSPMTEIIYVHSKLMIVDDCRCIIGSANINDRSLLGTRDSQLACIIEQNQGNILDLRYRVFNEHFGLTLQETKNILEPQVWQKIAHNAHNATLFYRQVFGCIPDDNVTVAAEVQKLASSGDLKKYYNGRANLIGHAVEYPLLFMKDEDMTFKLGQIQYIAPEMSFT